LGSAIRLRLVDDRGAVRGNLDGARTEDPSGDVQRAAGRDDGSFVHDPLWAYRNPSRVIFLISPTREIPSTRAASD
jgi:hypothetical protein